MMAPLENSTELVRPNLEKVFIILSKTAVSHSAWSMVTNNGIWMKRGKHTYNHVTHPLKGVD
jgi:predicted secreted protein